MTKILFIGDIVGNRGRAAVAALLPGLRREFQPDLVIANGENAAGGFGITKKIYDELIYDCEIDVLTSGNHVWDKKEIIKEFPEMDKLIRPLNYPNCTHGAGYRIDEKGGVRIATVNALGRVFVHWSVDCPFRAMDALLEKLKTEADVIIVDFHAETTSEKKVFGFYLDGRVSVVLGTHTHVQTSDARLLPLGTAYCTDVGMVGCMNSVLGMQTKTAQQRFLFGLKEKFEVEEQGPVELNACFIEIDPLTKKAVKITSINREFQ
jgi:2',3'-cyclic-nucleotide 2'-phosphodiesterase